VPQHLWFDLTDVKGDYGVGVLNDSKYGSDKPTDNTVRLTLLYTPQVRSEYKDQASQDIGRHDVVYALTGHAGDWSASQVPWSAARINQPLYAFRATSHPGTLGKTYAPISLNSAQVKVAGVKIAEDNDEVIVRVKELTGKAATGLQLTMAGEIASVREVNGQEREVGPAQIAEGKLAFDLSPFAVKAFAIKLAKPATSAPAITSTPVPLAYDLDAISTDKNRADGDFDGKGHTYPAEQLPASLEREGISFRLGSGADGAKNAVAAKGQKLELPAGDYNRVYLLVSSTEGDISTTAKLGETAVPLVVQQWNGFVGQWDNRIWAGEVNPRTEDTTYAELLGLSPGYIKPAPVAWFATHYHEPKDNTYYQFSYLYKHGIDLPKGTTSLTLPDNDKIRVFAVTVANEPGAGLTTAAPLYDTLESHVVGSSGTPEIVGADVAYNDFTSIALRSPLYYQPNDLRYTLDGTEPKADSPIYVTPLGVNRELTLKVAQLLPGGQLGPVASKVIKVDDKTPPVMLRAGAAESRIGVTFSEPVDEVSAKDPANYKLDGGLNVRSVELEENRRSVTLVLDQPLPSEAAVHLTVSKVADSSPNANLVADSKVAVTKNRVYHLAHAKLPEQAASVATELLPLKGNDSWTLHAFVKPSKVPTNNTLVAGFGASFDKQAENGQGRFLAIFKDGIRFWGKGRDVVSNSPVEANRWQLLTVVYDGKTITLYKDAEVIGKKEIALTDDTMQMMHVGIKDAWNQKYELQGEVSAVALHRAAETAADVKAYLQAHQPK
jgi:alpha-mannosidase